MQTKANWFIQNKINDLIEAVASSDNIEQPTRDDTPTFLLIDKQSVEQLHNVLINYIKHQG